jgi:hypothetical protein
MKQIFILSFLLSISFGIALAQKESTPDLPIDKETGKITFTEVVELDEKLTQDQVYSKAREWFAKAYNSSSNVIQMDDMESGKIVGKALMEVYHKSLGMMHPSGQINYTISIYMKEGRYKYEITDLYHTSNGSTAGISGGPCEEMINSKEKTMGMSHQKFYNQYLNQMNANIQALTKDLTEFMASNATSKNDDW